MGTRRASSGVYAAKARNHKPSLVRRVADHPLFEAFVYVAIIINAFLLASTAGEEDIKCTTGSYIAELCIFSVYLLELVVKLGAYGIDYFADGWNRLDFLVVCEGIYTYIIARLAFGCGKNLVQVLAVLRLLRILKPLRKIPYLRETRLLVSALLDSARKVVIGCVVISMFIYFFAVVGNAYLAEKLDKRCVQSPFLESAFKGNDLNNFGQGVTYNTDTSRRALREAWRGFPEAWKITNRDICGSCDTCRSCRGSYMANTTQKSNLGPPGTPYKVTEYCIDVGYSIDGNKFKFNTVGWATLAVFDLMQLYGWDDPLWSSQDGAGASVWIYYYLLVGVLAFMALNIFPAIVSFELRKGIREDEKRRAGAVKKRREASREELGLTQLEDTVVDVLAAQRDDVAEIDRTLNGGVASGGGDDHPDGYYRAMWQRICDPPLGWFQLASYLVIVCQVILLACETPNMAPWRRGLLDGFTIFFQILWAGELALRLFAYGLKFFRDPFNTYDLVLFTLLLAGDFARLGAGDNRSAAWYEVITITIVLRLVNFARVGRLRRLTTPQMDLPRIVAIVTTSWRWLYNALFLLVFLMYFFAVLGMTLFRGRVYSLRGEAQLFWYSRNRAYRTVVDDTDGGTIAPDFFPYEWSKTCDPPMNCRGRFNFDSFGMAFLTVFVVVTQDHWNNVMYEAIRSKPKLGSQALYSVVPYFVFLVLLRYIFVATVIAIIFDQVERDAVAVVRRDARVNMVSVFRLVGAQDKALKRRAFARWQGKAAPVKVGQQQESREGATYGDRGRGYVMLEENKEKPQTLWEQLRDDERSLYLFRPDHPVRVACTRVVRSPYWMYFMSAIVVIAVATLAQELYWVHVKDWAGVSNRLPSLEVRNSYRALSNFCLALFILEFFVEAIARGAWFPAKTAHLRSPLRRLDTGVTVLQFVGAFVSRGRAGHYLQMFEILRLLRLWQPLKLLARRSRAVSGVFAALDFGSGALLNVLMIVVVFFVLFAIVGMQLFMRTMQFCNDPGYPAGRNLDHVVPYGNVKPLDFDNVYGNVERLNGNIYGAVGCRGYQVPWSEDCDIEALWLGQRCPLLWAKVHRYKYHFDAFWAAITTTARNFTFDGWVRNILDVVNGSWHKYRQPVAQSGSQTVAGFYFFLLGAASIIVTILFISVIYGTFTYVTISRRGKEVWRILTLRHAHWAFYRTKLETVKPIRELPPPSQGATKFSKGLYRFYHTRLYKFIYVSLVLLDVFGWTFVASGRATLVPTKHRNSDPQSSELWFKVLFGLDIAICWLLVLDFAAKVLAFGRAHVFYYRREFFTMAALIPVAFHAFVQTLIACGAPISAGVEAFAHACRATIVFLLVPFIPDAINLFQTIASAGMTILPLMLLALVVTYAFAIAGMMLYSSLMGFRIDAREANDQKSFAAGRKNPFVRRIDFFTVAKGMNALFVGATANQWVTFADMLRDNSSGHGDEKIHTWASWVFWSAYALFMRYLFMNLCTLVVIYKYERRAPEQPQIAMDQVREFRQAWLKYDPRGSGVIAPEALRDLVTELKPPLGVGPGAPLVIVNRHALRLLVALPPGALPGDAGEADRDARWRSLRGFADLEASLSGRQGTQRQLVQPRATGALEAVRSEQLRAAPSDSSGGAPAAPDTDADGIEPRSPVFDSAASVEVSLDDEDIPVETVARNVEAKRHYPFSFYSRANTERRLDDLGDDSDDDEPMRATDLDALDALRATLKFRDAPPLAPREALPACLRFRHVLIAAHRMAFFPDLQDLPDDDAVAARRASARTKLNVLRLGVDRHVVAQEAKEGANLLVLLAKKKDDAAQADLSRMRRVLPDLFRERLRHCLALETHRWQQRIGYAAFDDEAFAECELLCTILHDEHMATGLQVSVVDRLGARGALALLHERRPHLLRHERFLEELWARVRSVRGTYVLKSWRPEATYVAGKFPPFGAAVVSLVGTTNAKRLFALSGGRLTVWRRDSRWKPPHIRAREKQLHPSLDDAPEEEEIPREEYEKAPKTKEELEEREDDARAEAQKTKYEKSLEPEPLVRIFEADVPREEGAFVQAVAVSPDGTYVVVAAGPEVIRYKKKENTRKETYEVEATMAPSASYARSDVMALCVVNNRLFTGDARGTLRLWALRGAEPQKYAYLRDGISALEVADEYALSLEEDGSGLKRRGLTLYAGMRDGTVGAMSVEFDQSWLLSTEAWEPAASVNAGAGVTCMTWHWDLLFVGTVAGAIAVIRPIRVSDETTHVASVAGDPDLDPIDAATKARRTLELRKILRLERVGVLNCHSRPVAQLAPCGNALYSASRDMALAAWRRPRVVIGTDGKGSLDARPPKPSITHEAPLTGVCPLAGLLATTDAKGVGQLHAAAEEDEEVVPPEAQLTQEPDDEEVLETPAFFYDGPLSKLTPRAFLAKLFWHYYPPTHTLHKPVSPTWRGKSHATLNTDAVSLEIDEDEEESISSYASSYESGSGTGSETGSATGSETGSSSYESYTGSSDSPDESALSADEDSNFGSDDIPASAYAGAAGAVTAGAAVANPVGHSAELDYTGPELAHSAELDYAGGDDLPELLPREAAQAPAPRGFARPGDLPSGGVV